MNNQPRKDNQIVKVLLVVLLIVLVVVVAVAIYKGRATNQTSISSTSIKQYPLQDLMPQGSDNDQIITHTAYTVGYNNAYKEPEWVFYELTADHTHGQASRSNNFRLDPAVSDGSANPADYIRSGYDKGHLVPAGDMKWDGDMMSETFYMSNMCPQKPGCNRGIWKHLEDKVRYWAERDGDVYVSAGPIFYTSTPTTIGYDHVAIPDAFFKVVAEKTNNQYKGIAFIIQNEGSNEPLQNFAVTIDSVQHLTGINFFAHLPDSIQQSLEQQLNLQQWFSTSDYPE